LAGLHPAASSVVKPPYVAESPYSVECKLHSHQDIVSSRTGKRTATLVLAEVVRFHVWKDAISEDKATVDPAQLRPVFRAGGITYGTCLTGFELPRPPAFRTLAHVGVVQDILKHKETQEDTVVD
jgi:flavin reductase (DIM6/NTAB) family NADH-FMN oxidoreductase RutF